MSWSVSTENRGATPEHFRPFVIVDEAGEVIARLPDGRAPADRAKAELLAAAPELLATCQTVLDHLLTPGRFGQQETVDMLETAIAKAKGA